MTAAAPLRVGIDARCLNTRHLRGMGKYVSEMLAHTGAGEFEWHLFADRPGDPFHQPAGLRARAEIFSFRGHRFHSWEQIGLPWRARRARVALLHSTATTLPYWQSVPTVVTVHDTLPWEESPPTGNFESWYLHKLIPSALARCWGIITISEASRRDILRLWPRTESKLHVIPHGVGDAYLDALPGAPSAHIQTLVGDSPYILYIGGTLERKRFAWAERVFGAIDQPKLRLVACGFTAEEAAEARGRCTGPHRERIVFPSFVAEQEMPLLYRNAVAVIYPTLYEGFGLPALESQAVGTPVLFSALGSLAELKGPGAEILPPEDFDAWVQTIRRLLRVRMSVPVQNDAARNWARGFSWRESALKHVRLYRQAARALGTGGA